MHDSQVEAEENTQFTYQKKKTLGLERKEAKMEKAEAEKYQKLQDNLSTRQVELQQFKLFHNERRIRECQEQIEGQRKVIDKVEKKKEKTDDALKDAKKGHGKSQRELAKVDAETREKENEIQKKRPAFIKAKEKTAHMQKKVDNAKKSLSQANKALKSHVGEVQELESELRAIERKKDEYEKMTADESQSQVPKIVKIIIIILRVLFDDNKLSVACAFSRTQGRNLQLEDSQVKEYHRLKEKAGKESGKYMAKLDSINREHKSDQDRLDTETRKKVELESKLKTKGHEMEEAQKRQEKLVEHIRSVCTLFCLHNYFRVLSPGPPQY